MADEIIRMQDIYAEDIVGNINEVREARGTFESLDARLDNIDGNAPSPSTSDPAMDGTASPGSADTYSRGDHVHPTDTSRQAVIDSSHKLSSDLVDDTNNTHKFATAAQLQQISTNEANISSILDGTTIDSFGDVETALSGKQAALTTAQLAAVNSGIDSTKVAQISTNENNISTVLDADGKKQLIPNFGMLTSGDISYTQNGTSITATGSKNSGELNYVNVISAPYEYFGLKANDKIVVKNSDSSPVYVGVGFDNGGYTANPTLVVGGTRELTLPSDKTYMYIRIGLLNSATTVSKTIQPLVCDKKLYDVSQTISQYAMSNAELTAKEQVNENKILLIADQSTKYNIAQGRARTLNDVTSTVSGYTITFSGTSSGTSSFSFLVPFSPPKSGEYIWKYTNGVTIGGTPISVYMWDTTANVGVTVTDIEGGSKANLDSTHVYTLAFTLQNNAVVSGNYSVMIISKDLWDKGFTDFQPYAMSNAELTAAIQALQAQLANQ